MYWQDVEAKEEGRATPGLFRSGDAFVISAPSRLRPPAARALPHSPDFGFARSQGRDGRRAAALRSAVFPHSPDVSSDSHQNTESGLSINATVDDVDGFVYEFVY